jgi:PTS system galactitol-specific IIA component
VGKLSSNVVLYEDLILLHPEASTKEEVIASLSNQLLRFGHVKDTFYEAVLKREEHFPTGLPTSQYGVAIPHTDIEHINQTGIAVAILDQSIPFQVMGSSEQMVDVHLVFLLAISDPNNQILVLQNLMEVFQDDLLLEKLKKVTSRKEVVDLIQSKFSRKVL